LLLAGRELVVTGQEIAQYDWSNHPKLIRLGSTIGDYFPALNSSASRESIAAGMESVATDTVRQTGAFLTDIVHFVVGTVIMGLALYYFLAEGPAIVRSWQAISPLEGEDENKLFQQFAKISRGVVLGVFVCAFAQAALLAIGLVVAGVERVWLLTGLTLLLSMIPFVGAAGIWIPVAAWLVWQGDVTKGLLLALYGAAIVSTADNLIRAYVLHGSAKMHPLLALISALGALQVVGLWGIFLGPVVAAFFYSTLKILHDRLEGRRALQLEAASVE
jgi:predicted PurR-regulated permease PerM